MGLTYWTVILLVAISGAYSYDKLKVIYSWKAMDFAYPNDVLRQIDIDNGDFIPGAPLPIDVDVYTGGPNQKSKVFISIPRFQGGVPVTLGYITDQVSSEGNPIIAPYPCWEWNKLRNCDRITSVYRMQVDQCGRLWVLDTGILMEEQICPPQIHVFDLQRDVLISQYKFPKDQYKEASIFVTLIVDILDTRRDCENTFAYIADVTGFGLLVYDYRKDRSWRINNNLFYPYPPHGSFHISGDSFDLMDGIIGLALSPLQPNGDKILYFHSLASSVESSVPTSVIRNYSLFHGNPDAAARSFVPFAQERSSQSAAEAMDRNGVLFFGLMSDLAIGCWNSVHFSEFGGSNNEIVITNHESLQFASGMKIITGRSDKQELWVLTPSFQRFMVGAMNSNETNFRIQAGFIDELVRGTKCDVSALGISGSRIQRITQLGK